MGQNTPNKPILGVGRRWKKRAKRLDLGRFSKFANRGSIIFLLYFFLSLKTIKKYTKWGTRPRKKWSFGHKNKNRRTSCEFGIRIPHPQTSPNFKAHKTFVMHEFLLYIRIYIYCTWTIYHIFLRYLKNQKN